MKVATGWIGWTEEQALATRIQTILAAYEGRNDLLKRIFGSGKAETGKTHRRQYSTKDPKAMARLFDKLK